MGVSNNGMYPNFVRNFKNSTLIQIVFIDPKQLCAQILLRISKNVPVFRTCTKIQIFMLSEKNQDFVQKYCVSKYCLRFLKIIHNFQKVRV